MWIFDPVPGTQGECVKRVGIGRHHAFDHLKRRDGSNLEAAALEQPIDFSICWRIGHEMSRSTRRVNFVKGRVQALNNIFLHRDSGRNAYLRAHGNLISGKRSTDPSSHLRNVPYARFSGTGCAVFRPTSQHVG